MIEYYLDKKYISMMKSMFSHPKFFWVTQTATGTYSIKLDNTLSFKKTELGSDLWSDTNKYVTLAKLNLFELLRNGIKTVVPKYENCIALENTKINIAFSDYAQPYPCFAIQLDDVYRHYLRSKFSLKAVPNILSIYQEEIGSPITVNFISRVHTDDFITIIVDTKESPTIESYLSNISMDKVNDKKIEYIRSLERIALNTALMLTHFGVESKGKYRQPGRKHKHDELIEIVTPMHQEIKWYERTIKNYEYEGGTHARPHPHWRKGHWKMQPYGPDSALRKRIFLKPVFVCADDYKGDISDTSVNYGL